MSCVRKVTLFGRCAGRLCSAFYFSAATPNDWTSPQNASLWLDGVKTLFDPCPAGWRVPKGGEGERSPWLFFCVEKKGAGTPNAVTDVYEEGPEGGFHFYCDNSLVSTAWYPASGSRYGTNTEILHPGAYGHSRSATMAPSATGYFLTLVPMTIFPFDNAVSTSSNASGLPVRCVRE